MTLLIVGIIVFLGVHLLPTATDLRARAVARLGEGGYKGAFSLLSLASLALLIYGYATAPVSSSGRRRPGRAGSRSSSCCPPSSSWLRPMCRAASASG